MKKSEAPAFLLYMPVYHNGHRELFARHPRVKRLFLLPRDEIVKYSPAHKDLHGLPEKVLKKTLQGLDYFEEITVVTEKQIPKLKQCQELIVPYEEDVLAWIKDAGVPEERVKIEDIFLRWTKKKILQAKEPPSDASVDINDGEWLQMMKIAEDQAAASSDYWRRVGAVLTLARGGTIYSHNHHMPEEQTPYMVGDMRGQFHKGEHWELTSAIHAEAAAIALAAKLGLETQGGKIFITDFPCPNCAKLIAAAGISQVYYRQSYALADAVEILHAYGIKIIRVTGEPEEKMAKPVK
ncbi:hypothetical protein IJJ27_02990 [bacterium]|nr:hypothetical protein [bacterium]